MKREKTAAERQMEALRRLKEQSGRSPAQAAPQAKPSLQEGSAGFLPLQLSASRRPLKKNARSGRRGGHSLPLSEEGWRSLVARFGNEGKLRSSKSLGDWAALLASRLPEDLKSLSEADWAELIVKIEQWCDQRHKGG